MTQAIVFGESAKVTAADFDSNLPKRPRGDFSADAPQNSPMPSAVDLTQRVNLKKLIKEQTIALKRRYIEAALEQTGHNRTAAGKLLGISYQTLDNWRKKWEN